jgi:aryl-alcohol dehydrogenase-like predicted oxidoreductase
MKFVTQSQPTKLSLDRESILAGQTQSIANILQDVQMGIGTWAWGDRLYWGFDREYTEKDLRASFQTCIEAGINFFDTAEIYAQGKSEQLLGQFAKEFHTPIRLATKFMPYPWRLSRGSLIKALRGSLKRLGLPKVDLYMIHFPNPPITLETWMDAMVDVYQEGLIASVGISNCDRTQMQRAYDALIRQGVTLTSNQVEYNLLNRKVEKNGLLGHCRDLGVVAIAYSPLAQGILSGKYSAEHPLNGIRSTTYTREMLHQIQPLLTLLKKIGLAHGGMTSAQVAINWVICKGVVPIPGVKNVEQALQNTNVLNWRLNEDEVLLLDDVSNRVVTAEF